MIASYGVVNDDYVSKLNQQDEEENSAQLSQTYYNLCIFVIIVSVFVALGLILYQLLT